jgi:broad specificity phosphatase PhoE
MSNTETTLYFIRHAAAHNPGSIFYGRMPRVKLSSEGLQQAQKTADYFKHLPVGHLYSSPMLRARQTAQFIALAASLPHVSINAYLNETNTPFQGSPTSLLDKRNWDLYSGNVFPYEQPLDIFNRAQKFIRYVLKKHPGQSVAAVTHADLIVFLSLWANNRPVDFPNKSLIEHKKTDILFPAPASITKLTWNSGQEHPHFEYISQPHERVASALNPQEL